MQEGQEDRAVGSVRAWDVVVAAMIFGLGALVIWDSRRLGAAWASDGPQAGYFPFYIGIVICLASVANVIMAFMSSRGKKHFVTWGQLRMVLAVMVPSVVYVALIANPLFSFGIYEASVIFIAVFMRVLGKYSWPKTAAVAIGVMVVFFLMFEVWFKVPLPKGPIEALLGFE